MSGSSPRSPHGFAAALSVMLLSALGLSACAPGDAPSSPVSHSASLSAAGNLSPGLSFGNVDVGQSSRASLDVVNSGGAALTVTQASATGAGMSVVGPPLPLTLAPGAGASVTVEFAPASAGAVQGTLTLTSNAVNSPTDFPVDGTGVGAPPPPVAVVQTTTFSVQPSSAGAVIVALPHPTGAGNFLVVGTSFWPLDVSAVADSAGDGFTRGLATSPQHNVAQGGFYSNFYFAPTRGGATSVTVSYSGGATYALIAVAEVSGIAETSALDQDGYHDSATATAAWTSASVSAAAGDYLFAWGATEWSGETFSAPGSGWRLESQRNDPNGAAVVLLDRIASAAGSYAASVTASAAANYGMPVAAFKAGASSSTDGGTTQPPDAGSGSTVTSVAVSCGPSSVQTGQTSTCTATVSGTGSFSSAVTWATSCGTISSSGVLTAPASACTATVTATSIQDSREKGSATVPVTAPSNTVLLTSFGAVGQGGDDTGVFQKCITTTAQSGEACEVPAGSYNISPVSFPAGAHLKCDANVVVSANAGYGQSECMLNVSGSNVTIEGAGGASSPSASACVFQMPKSFAQSVSDGSQYRHCLVISGGADNVNVSGISCNEAGGDGVYVRQATHVTVSNSVFAANFRNGGSLTGQTNHTTFSGNQFINQRNMAHAGIADGFDVEPNSSADFVEDFNFNDNVTSGNQLDGFCNCVYALNATSNPLSVNITGNRSDNNDRYGYFLGAGDPTNAAGAVNLIDSSSDGSGASAVNARFHEANGHSANVTNMTVTNSNRLGADPNYGFSAAVAISGGGGNSSASGNVHYSHTNVSSTNGKMQYYFVFEDGSGHGLVNSGFDLSGALSGRTGSCNGLLNGSCASSVSIP
jgi:hypothetical protein